MGPPSSDPRTAPGARASARFWGAALAGCAAWAAGVPYLGSALGARLDVTPRVEIADHVVPGAVVLAAALLLLAGGRRARAAAVGPGDLTWSVAAGTSFLAGFWIAATHAPLLAEAADGVSPWGAALLHLTAALPALVAGGWMLLAPILTGSRLPP